MKKKLVIILLAGVGVIGVAGGVGYFFFWEDLRLLFGGAPAAKSPKGGSVDLVADFTGGSGSVPPASQPAAVDLSLDDGDGEEGEVASTGAPVVEDAVTVESPESLDLGGEEEVAEEADVSKKPAPKPEAVPTLSRKSSPPPPPAAPAEIKRTPKPPPPPEPEAEEEEKPAARPRPKPAPQPRKSPRVSEPPTAAATGASIEVQKRAQMLIQKKLYGEAELLLTQYLAKHPEDGDVHFMMGFLRIQQNRKELARPYFKAAVKTSKDPQIRMMAEQYLKKLR